MGSAAMAEYLLFVRLDSGSLVQYGDPPRRSLHFQVRSVSLVTRAAESIETADQRQVGPQSLRPGEISRRDLEARSGPCGADEIVRSKNQESLWAAVAAHRDHCPNRFQVLWGVLCRAIRYPGASSSPVGASPVLAVACTVRLGSNSYSIRQEALIRCRAAAKMRK